jgi:hypothetical protein
VVRSDGGVSCAGNNGNGTVATGQIGQPLAMGVGPFLELLDVPLPAGSVATEVVVGTNFSCALLSDQTIACWGANDVGQLGRGPLGPTFSHVATGVSAPGLRFRGVVATQFAACAFTGMEMAGDMPDVYCWGSQAEGVTIGQPILAYPAGTNVPTPAGGTRYPLSGLAAGPRQVCGRVMTGQMTCWGTQSAGEFGLMPRTTAAGSYNTPQMALPGTGGTPIATQQMALGFSNGAPGLGGHACVIAGGDVYCWGSNVGGQVGVLPSTARVEDAVVVTP